VLRKIVGHLSKGYRQRVGLAAALIHDPEVLVLDEPTAGLDPKQIIETRKLIQSLAGDHTIILSTHILPEASNTCNRIMIINRGKLVAEDTPENLTSRLQGFETMKLLVEGPADQIQETLHRVDGVNQVKHLPAQNGRVELSVETAPGHDSRRELARAVVESGWGLLELRPMGMSLEEIFLKLTTKDEAETSDEAPSAEALAGESASADSPQETHE
jgi:ABC-2 type transport system ATP-binding protein